jgi:putative copper resistance protein D
LFVASPFILYFSPLYELSLRSGLVHALVHMHFLVAGSLFCWRLVGVDPVPHRQPPGARMLYAVLALPFHAFLGIAIMGSTTVLAGDYYARLGRSWGPTPLRDQNTGGGLLWAAGDLVGFVLVVLLLRQWVRGDAVTAAREDRRIDAAEAVVAAEKDGTRPI